MQSLERFPAFNQNFRNLETVEQMFREFGYASRGCPLFEKFWIMLFHSPLKVAENSNRTFWFEWKAPLRYGKTGNKKHATCFATLQLNELLSDIARFTTQIKPVLQQIRLLTGLNVGGKTCNNAFKLVLQHVANQIACFLLPVFPYLQLLIRLGVLLLEFREQRVVSLVTSRSRDIAQLTSEGNRLTV